MSSLPVKLITPKMDFGLVSAINKTMDKNIFGGEDRISPTNPIFYLQTYI